jgi:hypothetical protein
VDRLGALSISGGKTFGVRSVHKAALAETAPFVRKYCQDAILSGNTGRMLSCQEILAGCYLVRKYWEDAILSGNTGRMLSCQGILAGCYLVRKYWQDAILSGNTGRMLSCQEILAGCYLYQKERTQTKRGEGQVASCLCLLCDPFLIFKRLL